MPLEDTIQKVATVYLLSQDSSSIAKLLGTALRIQLSKQALESLSNDKSVELLQVAVTRSIIEYVQKNPHLSEKELTAFLRNKITEFSEAVQAI